MSLRQKVLQGGVFLALREGCGIILSLVSIVLLTRMIGPQQYGLYAAVFGVFTYLYNLGQFGVLVYLVRMEEEHPKAFHQAFTLLLCIGFLLTGGLWLGGFSLLEQWINLPGFGAVAKVMLSGLPISLLSQVPLAKLERRLDYRKIAMIELANQFIYNLVALPLAFAGFGVWAMVLGWLAQQIQAAVLLFSQARYLPRLTWQPKLLNAIMRYSLGFSAANWAFQARSLVNPLLIGRFAGAEAVAYVALAVRMVDVLSFVRTSTYRISISALAQMQNQPARLRKALSDGMNLQILALGPLLALASWFGPILIPYLFGAKWVPVMSVFPLIAFSALCSALFNLHSSILYVLQRTGQVAIFHVLHIILFAGGTWLFVPRLGLIGYGWAEVVTLLGYGLVHFYVNQAIGNLDYGIAFLWSGAFGLSLFCYQIGWWAILPLLCVGVWSETRQTVGQYIQQLRGASAK
jgi:O-antigen/teichoic acid export membrane protein